ncbi:MAG TPA: hypothetical protein VM618_08425, partial [Acidimicrobiia bacterium]|nr:hypothetical protein [Acidimicrobiia bacterium]
MRPTRLALVGALCALTALAAASPMATAQAPGGTPVAVFEGRGLGSGVGLPLDGANYLASEEDADADEILERFFPGTSGGRREGLVRVEVAGSDHPREGVELTLPTGGTVRDGREVAVAPSFPITVPRGGRVKLWFEDERYRAEVVDGTSVSGTREATTPTTAAAPDATEAIPELASSQHSLWVEPRGEGGVIVSGDRVERRS